MPTNIVTAMTAIIVSVAAAFFDSGGLKAGTPSEIASTPVMAVQPLAKAVSTANVVSVPVSKSRAARQAGAQVAGLIPLATVPGAQRQHQGDEEV